MVMAVLCGGLSQVGLQVGPVKRLRRKLELLKPAKRQERKFEELKQKVDLFNFVRESIERNKIKRLLQGDMPRQECKTWLETAEKIISEVNDILKDEGKGSDFNLFFHKRVGEKLMKMHYEIADQLEKSNEMMIDSLEETLKAAVVANVKSMMPVGRKQKVTRHKAASELIHLPLHKSMLEQDLVAAETEIGQEITPVPGTETFFAMYETGIHSNPAEFKETEIVESNLDVGKEEGQMKRRLQSSLKASMLVVKPKIIRPISNRIEERNLKRGIDDNVLKIIGLLRENSVRSIGIYGIGGIGKTTILKSLFNDRETNDMFDSIIWVTVSRHWSSQKIQDQLQMQLLNNLSGSNTNLHPKLLHSLKNKKLLFLLDDVWDRIDLNDAGIPVPSEEIDCRIIFTTRFLDVCRIMDADTKLEIQPISREEAWGLFHDQVGGIIYSTDIKLYAETIVAECGGLPLAIVVTGRALRKENNVLEWKHALRELLIPGTRDEHDSEAVIQQLKFCYDRLKARDVKDCFLYCASFQEDCDVNISELLNHLVDEGLVAGNMEDAFRRGNDIIQTLIEASMLESTSNGVSVKMHDVLRDFASTLMLPGAEGCHFLVRADLRLTQPVQSPKSDTFMTDKGHQFLFGAGAGSIEPPSNEKWEQTMMIFLMDNELFSLPESPSCPNLLSLFLQRNNHLRTIPESFFENMPCLEVLNLSQTKIKSLPRSLFKLNNLKALIIRDCKNLSILPSAIGALETLELLDLRRTAIYNLPDEVQSLTRLKHMTVSFYGSNNSSEYSKLPQTLVSDGVLSRLVHLTVLHIAVYPGDQRWSKSIKLITMEIQNLNELEMLEIHFPEVELLEQFLRDSLPWKDQRLTKFRFVVGHNVKRVVERVPDDVELDYNQQDRRLIFVNEETLPSAVKEVLSRSTAFYLDHHLTICKLSDFGAINLNALKFLILRECPVMQTVLNGKEVEGSAFPLLEHLSIHLLWSLEKICENPVPTGSFSKLRYLSVHTCPVLPFILPCSMAQNLHNLEVLIVEDCEAAKELIFNDQNIDPGEILLPKLKRLRLHYLPNLVDIWKGSWPPLEHISFYDCPNLTNLHMSFYVIDTIKDIKAEKEWWDELIWDDSKLFEQLQVCYAELCYDDL